MTVSAGTTVNLPHFGRAAPLLSANSPLQPPNDAYSGLRNPYAPFGCLPLYLIMTKQVIFVGQPIQALKPNRCSTILGDCL